MFIKSRSLITVPSHVLGSSRGPAWSPVRAGEDTCPARSSSAGGCCVRVQQPATAGPSSSAAVWRRGEETRGGEPSAGTPESEEPHPGAPRWLLGSPNPADLQSGSKVAQVKH